MTCFFFDVWVALGAPWDALTCNPYAPAQSKRTFAFSGKTWKLIEKTSISAPFFSAFLTLFRGVSRKPEKGAQGPATEPQKHTKMDPKGAQTEPTNQQTEPQGPTKYEKHAKISHQGWQSGAPSVTMESQGPPKCKKIKKNASQSANKTWNCAAKCLKTPKHT